MGSSSINQARHGETICTLCLVRRYTKCAQKTHSFTHNRYPRTTSSKSQNQVEAVEVKKLRIPAEEVCLYNALVRIKDCLSDAQSFSSLDAVVCTAWKC